MAWPMAIPRVSLWCEICHESTDCTGLEAEAMRCARCGVYFCPPRPPLDWNRVVSLAIWGVMVALAGLGLMVGVLGGGR